MHIKDSDFKNNSSISDDLIISLDSNDFKWRVILVYSILAAVIVYLFIGAFQLQLIEGERSLLIANRTNHLQTRILAPRGLIYDENGTKLAGNIPAYSLYIKPQLISQNDEPELIKKLATLLNINEADFIESYNSKVYNEAGVRSAAERITLKSDLTFDEYFNIISIIDTLPGVNLSVEAVRQYDEATNFANIIGYIGDPSQNDIDNGIYPESQVGKIGIERKYDEYLRGEDGQTINTKETLTGKQVQNQVIPPNSGDSVYLNIDSKWQIYLSDILNGVVADNNSFGGAAVVMNANTGEIKALVTNPNYDNNLFANGISGKDYSELINNVKKPLFNRPISIQLPPGSIMKIFGAAAILESGAVSADTKLLSDRCLDLPGNIKFCEADSSYLGWVNVKEALAKSSNIFFCKAMQELRSVSSYDYYYDIANSFGIGQTTGIDIGGEAKGVLPSADYKRDLINQPWYIGDECNTVIGQGYVTVTPLQMTVAVSAVVNGGNVLKPYLLDSVVNEYGEIVYKQDVEVVRTLNISDSTLKTIKDGLVMGVSAGTLGGLKALPKELNLIGKTGSSDAGEWINGKYYSGAHSWVMGCFDLDNETYCYTVMQQWGGRGYRTVPIMKKFINCLYNDFSDNCKAI